MKNIFLVVGIILILLSIIIRYIVAKRRFYRRDSGGLGQHRSFKRAGIIRFLEDLARIIAYVLLIAGVLSLILHYSA